MSIIRTFYLFAAVTLIMASLASGSPVVTISTTPNIGGSGFEAIDFYYASSAGADFTNYRLNLETTGGGYIYDPLKKELQNTGSTSIDTYMNTVGSYLGIGDAVHIQNTYKPTSPSTSNAPLTHIDWSVFDTLSGDSNAMDGYAPGPYHMARVLVSPDADWNASFAAFDTLSGGVAATWRFSNASPLGAMDPIIPPALPPEEPIILPPPPAPRPPLVTQQPAPGSVPENPPVATVPPDTTNPPETLPFIRYVEGGIDLLTWDPINPPQILVPAPVLRIPFYWVSYLPLLDATDPAILPTGIDHDGLWENADGEYTNFYVPQLYYTMFDGAVGSTAVTPTYDGLSLMTLAFASGSQEINAIELPNPSETPEPTSALLASVALATCAQLLARRRRA